jgi:hypothetical protein
MLLWSDIIAILQQKRLLQINEFEMLSPRWPTRYFLAGNCDVLDIVTYNNVRLSEIINFHSLDTDRQQVVFY